jgi:hypothetical protein
MPREEILSKQCWSARLMHDGGEIVAITLVPRRQFGRWPPWVAMGATKAALEVLIYFAVALVGVE